MDSPDNREDVIRAIVDGRTDRVFDWVNRGLGKATDVAEAVPLIRWCAYYGDVSAIRFLLAQGEAVARLGENLDLNGAAFHHHWRLCEFLLDQGADPNHPLPDTGETALHAAVSREASEAQDLTVLVLLQRGAEPNRATKPGIETGCYMRDVRTRSETALHRAAASAGEVTVQRLIEAGASREARDVNGDTPLTWASWARRPDAVLRLLCYVGHSIHPQHRSMESNLLGRPENASLHGPLQRRG